MHKVTKSQGTVIDGTGEPIIGANVLEVGTTNGVITDIDGNFKLSVQPNAKIQVSFIGYITQTVTVGSQKNIKVTLKEDAQALDEVVVVGYGTMKKTDVTGFWLRFLPINWPPVVRSA
ncbi:carboxypeptidase-like regulatory domain-containing protein [Bacteroides stercoris]|nr:carboxypeptidase-like regulatory domain-containing protein [Bacteroides stercoris]